jgi:ribosome recycling factor
MQSQHLLKYYKGEHMSAIIDQAREQMNKSVEATKENFMGIRTGRANPALLNGIMVDYYGAPTPIKAVASIGVPEPRTLSVTPFDASQANAVEKAIRDSDLGVSPNRDGNVIRVTMPELTEERRKEYVKLAKNKAEEGKVAVRNIRRKAKESIDKSVKDGELGEDEGDRLQKELDKVTKQVTDSLDVLLEGKQKEIMEV